MPELNIFKEFWKKMKKKYPKAYKKQKAIEKKDLENFYAKLVKERKSQ
jgi:hypothetical protein|tara:strand:- start:401 stop:544 length:144 start_codon:yes stop_codon:yes gene_type:complete